MLTNDSLWFLGEVLNWLHVMIIPGGMALGWLWIRPIWLYPIFAIGVPVSWSFVGRGECVVTYASNWLQGTDYSSFFKSFPHTYGWLGATVIIISMVVLGCWLPFRFRQPVSQWDPFFKGYLQKVERNISDARLRGNSPYSPTAHHQPG